MRPAPPLRTPSVSPRTLGRNRCRNQRAIGGHALAGTRQGASRRPAVGGEDEKDYAM